MHPPPRQAPALLGELGQLGELGEPSARVADLPQLLRGYVEWYRDTVLRKVAGLSDAQLRTVVEPLGWAPIGLVQHLGWVERRWLRWGFAAEDVPAHLPGGDEAEWHVPDDEPTEAVVAAYLAEVARSRALPPGSTWTSRPGSVAASPLPSRRPRSAGSCSTFCRSTRVTSASSTWRASSLTARPASRPPRRCGPGRRAFLCPAAPRSVWRAFSTASTAVTASDRLMTSSSRATDSAALRRNVPPAY